MSVWEGLTSGWSAATERIDGCRSTIHPTAWFRHK